MGLRFFFFSSFSLANAQLCKYLLMKVTPKAGSKSLEEEGEKGTKLQ